MTLRSILVTALVIGACWYWIKSRELKEAVLQAASRKCESLGVDLLDQSVVLKALKPVRSSTGSMHLYRRYVFEFTSTGEQRYQGEVIVLGRRIEKINLAPHRVD